MNYRIRLSGPVTPSPPAVAGMALESPARSDVVAEYLNSSLIVHCRVYSVGKSYLITYHQIKKALNLVAQARPTPLGLGCAAR